MMVSKLPNGLIYRWNRCGYNIRKKHECEPFLSDLIELTDQETTLVNAPMFSRKALECYRSKPEKHNDREYRKIKPMAIKQRLVTAQLALQDKALKNVIKSKDCQSMKVMTVVN